MEKDSGTVFRELKEDVSAYVELKLELLKLSTYERTGKVIAVLSYGLILLLFGILRHLVHILGLGLLPRGLARLLRVRIRYRGGLVPATYRHYNNE